LQSLAVNLGVSILGNATESIQEALRTDKLDQAIYFINRLVPTARLMHHRALAHFGLTDEKGDFPENLFEEDRADTARKRAGEGDAPQAPWPQRTESASLDRVLQSPLHAFAERFRKLVGRPVFRRGELTDKLFGQPGEIVEELAA